MGARAVARRVRDAAAVARLGLYARPGHFYSPLSAPEGVARALAWRSLEPVDVDLRAEEQLALAGELAGLMTELPVDRWRPGNEMFNQADAAVLHAMLRWLAPRRVLEVGSGYSTGVMLDARERWLPDLSVTCIEPYPRRLRSRLRTGDQVRLHQVPVQAADPSLFADLAVGDVLFIDSTHVAKAGSDVNWLVLHVLPTLAPGVFVHIHDIFWPFEYPEVWLRERRDWTELYLVHAFLSGNTRWRVELMASWLWTRHPQAVPATLRAQSPGSLWLRKVGGCGSGAAG